MEIMIEFQNTAIGYRGDPVPVMTDINLIIQCGDQIAVIGPNGAGKSTLFKSIVGLIPPLSGRIIIHGRENCHHKDCISYIPQKEKINWNFPVTVRDVVMMGRYGKLGHFKRQSAEDEVIVQDAMEQMEISNLADRKIKDCSGGQQQRVFLARSIAQQPHVLIMDEPFNGVDAPTRQIILKKLKDFKEQGVTVITSTHDFEIVSRDFEKTLLLDQEILAFGKTSEVMTAENLRKAFGGNVVIAS